MICQEDFNVFIISAILSSVAWNNQSLFPPSTSRFDEKWCGIFLFIIHDTKDDNRTVNEVDSDINYDKRSSNDDN